MVCKINSNRSYLDAIGGASKCLVHWQAELLELLIVFRLSCVPVIIIDGDKFYCNALLLQKASLNNPFTVHLLSRYLWGNQSANCLFVLIDNGLRYSARGYD